MRTQFLFPLLLLLAACASTPDSRPSPAAAPAADFGLTRQTAIDVCQPTGQRAYLARLTCPNGRRPSFERIGSVGARQPIPDDMSEGELDRQLDDMVSGHASPTSGPDYHIIDAYSVACGTATTTLYLDMYHCGVEPPSTAPAGFGIDP